jgi:hypothetical protein
VACKYALFEYFDESEYIHDPHNITRNEDELQQQAFLAYSWHAYAQECMSAEQPAVNCINTNDI